MSILAEIADKVGAGNASTVKELIQKALDSGTTPGNILNGDLVKGMEPIGI